MDGTRKDDLKELEKMKQGASSDVRSRIQQTQQAIVRQMGDRRLSDMRYQLANAMRSGKGKDVQKLNMQIKDHERREGYG